MAIATALLITAVAAPAAEAQRPAIEILSPQRGADHVSASKPMRVRVRVAPSVRNLRATVAGRDRRAVTRRFKRGRRGIWTATLRIGRELDRGPGALTVKGRRRGAGVVATAHFFVITRRAEMLRVRGVPRRTAARPLDVRLKTADRVDNVRVQINGRGARDVFTSTAGGTWSGTLSPNEGLRFGRNRVTITAYDRGGAFERVRRVVSVRRGRALVGAGKDRLVQERERVRLDGRGTLPHGGKRMRLTWRIVQRPEGSTARLRNRHAVRPHLRTDRPGMYRVRLTASPRRARDSASAAAVQSSDVVNVGAQPLIEPKGQPIRTIGDDNAPGIEVSGVTYPMGSGDAVQMLVLDGGTTAVRDNESFPGTDAGMSDLQSKVSAVPSTSIVVLQHPTTRSINLNASGEKALAQVFSDLGVEPDSSTGRWLTAAASVPVGGWSVVSATDGRTGSALIGLQQSPDRPEGEMDGFLQNSAGSATDDAGSTWLFSWPSTFNTFDTRSGGDNATYNEMTLAGQTYRSNTISQGSSAFHLVWLDGGTLALRGQATIPGDQGEQLAQTLAGIRTAGGVATSPTLVFMTTIGHPNITRPSPPEDVQTPWADAAEEITTLGGNLSAFLSLNGAGNAEYSLVGPSLSGTQTPNAGVDVSRVLRDDLPTARLVGVLERKPGGAWRAATGGAPSAVAGGEADVAALVPDIKRVLAQPDQPFTRFTGTGEAEAEQYIADQLNIDYDQTYGIRVNYWDPTRRDDWDNLSREIGSSEDVPPCTTSPCNQGFQAVQEQLNREFDAVSKVRTYFGTTMSGALGGAYTDGTYGFDAINDYIISKYPPAPTEAKGPSPFDIVEGLVDGAAELVPEGDTAILFAKAIGVTGAMIEIGGSFADIESGSQDLGATVYEAHAAQFASSLQTDFSNSLAGLHRVADLLVADAGRLQAAGVAVRTDWAVDADDVTNTLERSISAYMWGALLPTTFKAYQCVSPPVYYPPEDFRPQPWYAVNVKTPAALQYTPFTTMTHHPAKRTGAWGPSNTDGWQVNDGFVTIGRYADGEHHYLDTNYAQDIFGPLDGAEPRQLGQLPAYFLAPQPNKNAPGFDVDQGTFDPNTENGYVTYTCGGNTWREDTNIRGR